MDQRLSSWARIIPSGKKPGIFSLKAEITLRRVFRLNVVDLQPILDEGECHSKKASVKK
jgi:hypothetical protein